MCRQCAHPLAGCGAAATADTLQTATTVLPGSQVASSLEQASLIGCWEPPGLPCHWPTLPEGDGGSVHRCRQQNKGTPRIGCISLGSGSYSGHALICAFSEPRLVLFCLIFIFVLLLGFFFYAASASCIPPEMKLQSSWMISGKKYEICRLQWKKTSGRI